MARANILHGQAFQTVAVGVADAERFFAFPYRLHKWFQARPVPRRIGTEHVFDDGGVTEVAIGAVLHGIEKFYESKYLAVGRHFAHAIILAKDKAVDFLAERHHVRTLELRDEINGGHGAIIDLLVDAFAVFLKRGVATNHSGS